MEFKTLNMSVASSDFWECSDIDAVTRFTNSLLGTVNSKDFIRLFYANMPQEALDLLKGVPVMVFSTGAKHASHIAMGFNYINGIEGGTVAGVFALNNDDALCGISIPIESLHHKPSTIIDTVKHELVHYDQWLRGDFSCDPEHDGFIWKGRRYTNEYINKVNTLPYEEQLMWEITNLPWEYEAYANSDITALADEGSELMTWLHEMYGKTERGIMFDTLDKSVTFAGYNLNHTASLPEEFDTGLPMKPFGSSFLSRKGYVSDQCEFDTEEIFQQSQALASATYNYARETTAHVAAGNANHRDVTYCSEWTTNGNHYHPIQPVVVKDGRWHFEGIGVEVPNDIYASHGLMAYSQFLQLSGCAVDDWRNYVNDPILNKLVDGEIATTFVRDSERIGGTNMVTGYTAVTFKEGAKLKQLIKNSKGPVSLPANLVSDIEQLFSLNATLHYDEKKKRVDITTTRYAPSGVKSTITEPLSKCAALKVNGYISIDAKAAIEIIKLTTVDVTLGYLLNCSSDKIVAAVLEIVAAKGRLEYLLTEINNTNVKITDPDQYAILETILTKELVEMTVDGYNDWSVRSYAMLLIRLVYGLLHHHSPLKIVSNSDVTTYSFTPFELNKRETRLERVDLNTFIYECPNVLM